MNPLFIGVDLLIAIVALRSLMVLRARAPWTSAGWVVTLVYGVTAAAKYSRPGFHRDVDVAGYAMLLAMTIAFVIAAVHDEPQATPYWWPSRVGKTRAERRADGEP